MKITLASGHYLLVVLSVSIGITFSTVFISICIFSN